MALPFISDVGTAPMITKERQNTSRGQGAMLTKEEPVIVFSYVAEDALTATSIARSAAWAGKPSKGKSASSSTATTLDHPAL